MNKKTTLKKSNSQYQAQGRELSPLLPLEYCRIERAAQLLNCEVDDILHWGAIGAIELGVYVDMMRADLHFEGVNCQQEDSFDHLVGRLRASRKSLPTTHTIGAYGIFSPIDDMHKDGGASFVIEGIADGIWRVPEYALQSMTRGEVYALCLMDSAGRPLGLWTTTSSMLLPMGGVEDEVNVFLNPRLEATANVSGDDLWIAGACLQKLHHSITTGEPLPNIYNDAELAQRAREQDKKEAARLATIPHHSAERHAVNREAVLKAAMYCKEHFPDNCKTYVDWAETIDQKAPLFWPETSAPPLTRNKIERLLGEAHKLSTDR